MKREPQFVDEPVLVDALLSGGRVMPQTVTWREKSQVVLSVGRQWAAEDGTHVLVELYDGSRMELLLQANLRWVVRRYWPPVFAV